MPGGCPPPERASGAPLRSLWLLTACLAAAWAAETPPQPPADWRGTAVHLAGGGAPARTLDLAAPAAAVVHVLAAEPAATAEAVRGAGCADRVGVEAWTARALPYPDRTIDLLVAEADAGADPEEIRRVLTPSGSAWLAGDGGWRRIAGAAAADLDDWTHQRRGADGNPLSRDRILARVAQAPPDRLRWIADVTEMWPESLRIADGRIYLFDKRPKGSADAWVRCRSAWNGVLLWEAGFAGAAPGARPGMSRNRPIATADRIYLRNQRIVAVDARTGAEVASSPLAPLDLIAPADGRAGVLVARTADAVVGLDAATLAERWRTPAALPAAALAAARAGILAERATGIVADADAAYAVDHGDAGLRILAIALADGAVRELPAPAGAVGPAWPTLAADGVLVLAGTGWFAGAPVDGRGPGWLIAAGERRADRKLGRDVRVDADMAERLARCGIARDGRLWIQDGLNLILGPGDAPPPPAPVMGWIGIDLRDGAIRERIGYPTSRPWGGIALADGPTAPFTRDALPVALRNWSPRCYGDIAGGGAIISQTMEIVGFAGEEPRHLRGVRGHCGIGFAVGAGAVISPPNQCLGCYPMVRGALAYESADGGGRVPVAEDDRRLRGPAFAAERAADPAGGWPMYRASAQRTNCVAERIDPAGLAELWRQSTPGRASQAVAVDGTVVVAAVASGTITALDAATGAVRWRAAAPGRIDSPPTLHDGLVLAGCHDGRIYAFDRRDGRLAWRFTAAPEERRIVAGDRFESPWPVLGAVLVHAGTLHAIAGHHTSLDGGLQRWGLDPATGAVRYRAAFAGIKGPQAVILPSHWYRHEEAALNNLLVGGGIGGTPVARLYDEWGGWDFRADDGSLLRQHQAVPQPGWPQGRVSPGPVGADDRWPWVGHDRISSARILRGVPSTYADTLEMDPRTRFSGTRGRIFLWPAAGAPGVLISVAKGRTTVDPEPWVVPTDPAVYADPKAFAKDPARMQADLWAPAELPIAAAAAIMTGDVLWIAGRVAAAGGGGSATAPAPAPAAEDAGSALFAVSMRDGGQLGRWDMAGGIAFEGLSAADGRLLVVQDDGAVRCFGRR